MLSGIYVEPGLKWYICDVRCGGVCYHNCGAGQTSPSSDPWARSTWTPCVCVCGDFNSPSTWTQALRLAWWGLVRLMCRLGWGGGRVLMLNSMVWNKTC